MNTLLQQPTTSAGTSAPSRPKRLLLIAYNFPPVGGAGVQRPVKWVKNLRRFGWDVTVLTTENPSVPTRDESLLADIPEDVLVVRARTWEPDYGTKQGLVASTAASRQGLLGRLRSAAKRLVKRAAKLMLQPDPQVLWVPNAIQAGRQVLSEFEHDAILVTAPAYSSFFIGTSLKRQFGLPLVLDFRDEWDMSGKYLENAQRDICSRLIQERMQSHVLKRADAVVATTRASAANLAEKLSRLNKSDTPAVTVYNGFDAEDFATQLIDAEPLNLLKSEDACCSELADNRTSATPLSAANPMVKYQNRFRLLYTGTLWNLTTIEPLVDAILRLNQASPELLAKLELVCVGRKTREQVAVLERLKGTNCRLELIDYCEHSQILEWLRSASAVCLLLSDVPGAERVVPAKLFEYMANRRDMLSIVPRGETADIVQRFFPQGWYEPKNIAGIANWLTKRLSNDLNDENTIPQPAEINEYSRTTQTKRLVELLDTLVPEPVRAGRSGTR